MGIPHRECLNGYSPPGMPYGYSPPGMPYGYSPPGMPYGYSPPGMPYGYSPPGMPYGYSPPGITGNALWLCLILFSFLYSRFPDDSFWTPRRIVRKFSPVMAHSQRKKLLFSDPEWPQTPPQKKNVYKICVFGPHEHIYTHSCVVIPQGLQALVSSYLWVVVDVAISKKNQLNSGWSKSGYIYDAYSRKWKYKNMNRISDIVISDYMTEYDGWLTGINLKGHPFDLHVLGNIYIYLLCLIRTTFHDFYLFGAQREKIILRYYCELNAMWY